MDSEIKKTLTGSTSCILVNEKDLKKKNPPTYTATISGVSNVFSLFPGEVLFLGFYKNTGTITIAVSNHEIVRYMNLENIEIWKFDTVEKGQLLGQTKKNRNLQFEYCSQWAGDSRYPVRVNDRTFYKQNPLEMLEGKYVPEDEVDVLYGINLVQDIVNLTEDQLKEWGSYFPGNLVIDENANQITDPRLIPESAIYMMGD